MKRSHLGDALGCARTGGAGRGRLEPFEAPSAWRQCRRKKSAGNQIGMLSLERRCAGFFDSIRRLPTFGEVQFSPTSDHVSQRKRVDAACTGKATRLAGHRTLPRRLFCLELHDLKFQFVDVLGDLGLNTLTVISISCATSQLEKLASIWRLKREPFGYLY